MSLWVHRGGKDAAVLRGHSVENRGVGGGGELGKVSRKPPGEACVEEEEGEASDQKTSLAVGVA